MLYELYILHARLGILRAARVQAPGGGLWEGGQGPDAFSTGMLFQPGSLAWSQSEFPKVSFLFVWKVCPKVSNLTWEQMAGYMDFWEWWLESHDRLMTMVQEQALWANLGDLAATMSSVWPHLHCCRAASSLKMSRGPGCSPAIRLSRSKSVLEIWAFYLCAIEGNN